MADENPRVKFYADSSMAVEAAPVRNGAVYFEDDTGKLKIDIYGHRLDVKANPSEHSLEASYLAPVSIFMDAASGWDGGMLTVDNGADPQQLSYVPWAGAGNVLGDGIKSYLMNQEGYVYGHNVYSGDLSSFTSQFATNAQFIFRDQSNFGANKGTLEFYQISFMDLMNQYVIPWMRTDESDIDGERLLNNSVSGNKIKDGTITGGKIGAMTITGANLADGAVVSGTIAPNSVTREKLSTDVRTELDDLAAKANKTITWTTL